ncbi:tail fiber protein [Paenibacillus doosanensis]|uniref:phage tail protein n=1 Tax=Paenibacillus doosanensis TaxID=1229154 RepID=UPI00217FF84B|nr:tail fiber protein [Paenibacillus doosanensis]MCS7459125.1 tail fiber protein [Paenibacillus doosanensis]
MSEPFLGQIALFSFPFPPKGWALCNGQLLQISQNTALFSILGTVYGGDGVRTFALPNLQGRVPIHTREVPGESTITLGMSAGEASHTLTIGEMPTHTHAVAASGDTATSKTPQNNLWAKTAVSSYHTTYNARMSAAAVKTAGGSQPHENMQPYLTLNFCIALQGIFPSRT